MTIIADALECESMLFMKDFLVSYGREDVEGEWHGVENFETPVGEGLLGTWDVSDLPPGAYILRLTVVDRTGNYPFTPCEVRVYVTH